MVSVSYCPPLLGKNIIHSIFLHSGEKRKNIDKLNLTTHLLFLFVARDVKIQKHCPSGFAF